MVAALALGLSACGSDTPSSGSGTSTTAGAPAHISTVPDGNITVYSGQHEQTVSQLVSAFEAKTGVKVKVRSDDEGSLAQQLLAEGSATPADVFYAENPPALNVLDAEGPAVAHRAVDARQGAAAFSPASGNWVGVSARAVALAYNTSQLEPSELPTLDPGARRAPVEGQARHRARRDRLPAHRHHHHPARRVGPAAEAWLKGIKANSKIYEDNEALIAAVDKGEVETGIVDHYYWYRLRDEVGRQGAPALHYFTPGDPGALADVSGAGHRRRASTRERAGASWRSS